MEKIQMKGTVVVWVGSGVGTGVLWYGLQFLLPHSSVLYSFLLNAWLIQLASSWLFVVGLVFWVQRSWLYKKEGEALQKIRLPDHTIVREQARGLIDSMPAAYRQTR